MKPTSLRVLLLAALTAAGGAFAHTVAPIDFRAIFNTASDPLPEPLTVVPAVDPDLDRERVALGARLFNETKLSASTKSACSSCHQPEKAWSDGQIRSSGHDGGKLDRNTPSLLNLSTAYFFFLDGHQASLEGAVREELLKPAHMGNNSAERIVQALSFDPNYSSVFQKIYSDSVRMEYVVDAISSFIRTLNTTDSPFDRYLIGDKGALNRDQQQGLKLFRDYGCISCHNGAGLGGNLIQKNHLIDEYFDEHPEANEADLGLFVRTRDEYDRYAFRVPPLRNITLTAPYFHDGSSETLDHAIEEMAEHQLGIDLSPQEKGLIARFLESLTGTMPDSGTGVK